MHGYQTLFLLRLKGETKFSADDPYFAIETMHKKCITVAMGTKIDYKSSRKLIMTTGRDQRAPGVWEV